MARTCPQKQDHIQLHNAITNFALYLVFWFFSLFFTTLFKRIKKKEHVTIGLMLCVIAHAVLTPAGRMSALVSNKNARASTLAVFWSDS